MTHSETSPYSFFLNKMCDDESTSAVFTPRMDVAHTPLSSLSVSSNHPSVCVTVDVGYFRVTFAGSLSKPQRFEADVLEHYTPPLQACA